MVRQIRETAKVLAFSAFTPNLSTALYPHCTTAGYVEYLHEGSHASGSRVGSLIRISWKGLRYIEFVQMSLRSLQLQVTTATKRSAQSGWMVWLFSIKAGTSKGHVSLYRSRYEIQIDGEEVVEDSYILFIAYSYIQTSMTISPDAALTLLFVLPSTHLVAHRCSFSPCAPMGRSRLLLDCELMPKPCLVPSQISVHSTERWCPLPGPIQCTPFARDALYGLVLVVEMRVWCRRSL